MPSLCAAAQVADSSSVRDVADVFVLITESDPVQIDRLRESFSAFRINFLQLDPKLFLPPEGTYFNQTHISRTALGRFALHEVIPSNYEHIVYLDGDVRLNSSIDDLVNHDVKPGCIASANEFLWLCENDRGTFWPRHRLYLDSIGIRDPKDYFNSGVLAFRLDTWREMAPKALAYFLQHPERCIYHDQSALNAVFVGQREVLSPVYNFGTEFAKLGMPDDQILRILHFTGAEKPWYFTGPPWNGRFIEAYRKFIRQHPVLEPFARPPDAAKLAAINKASRRTRWRSQLLSPWRRGHRRRKLLNYLQITPFDVK